MFPPAHKYSTNPIHPTVSSLHEPATCLEAGLFDNLGLITPVADVRGKAELLFDISDFLKVVTFVQADALMYRCSRDRPHRLDAVQCASDQLHVVHVGTFSGDCNRNSFRLGQQAALDAVLASVCIKMNEKDYQICLL